jgi:hypothetical protein
LEQGDYSGSSRWASVTIWALKVEEEERIVSERYVAGEIHNMRGIYTTPISEDYSLPSPER